MGTVNIFLGGTGKEIAQDIQASHDFHHLDISEPIAFDLDATLRPGVELANLVIAGEETSSRVPDHGKAWANIDAGPGVGPADGGIGPRIPPETALLTEIGGSVRTQSPVGV